MFIKKILLISFVLSSILFYSCSDAPSQIGIGLHENDFLKIKELDSNKDSLAQNSSYLKRNLSIGVPNKLSNPQIRILVGKAANIEASTLINFLISLPDSIKDALKSGALNVVSAKIQLSNIYDFGDTNSTAVFDFTAHEILSKWAEHFSADSLASLSYNPNDISLNKSFTDTLNTFYINNDIALSWLNLAVDSISNEGIYLKPSDASDKVVGFQSLYGSPLNQPYLIVALEKPGVYADTLTFIAKSNVSVVSGILPAVNQSSIVVQSGLPINGKLQFDISKIPVHSIINNAELTLNLDSTATIVGKNSSNTILAVFVTDSSQIIVDSSAVITLTRTNNYFTGTITSFVQKWLDSKTNEGILLFTRDQSFSVDLYTIYGSNSRDAFKPKLNIIYTSRD